MKYVMTWTPNAMPHAERFVPDEWGTNDESAAFSFEQVRASILSLLKSETELWSDLTEEKWLEASENGGVPSHKALTKVWLSDD